jgi:hypothetical protein
MEYCDDCIYFMDDKASLFNYTCTNPKNISNIYVEDPDCEDFGGFVFFRIIPEWCPLEE